MAAPQKHRSLLIPFLLLALSLPILLLIYSQIRLGAFKENATAGALLLVGVAAFGYYALRLFGSSPSSNQTSEDSEGVLDNAVQEAVRKLKQMKEEAQAYAETLENYNENILRSVTSGVMTFDCNGKVTTLNPAAETILGLKKKAALGNGCEEIFGANNIFSFFLKETLDQKKDVLRKESEVVRCDGKKVWLGLTTSALRDQKGAVIGAIIVFTDLTEMKVLQDQVDLKKRLALLGEMSAFIAHEFRNYMGTIWGFASMLSKELKSGVTTPASEGAQKMTAGIIKELATMEQLITDMLSYGKKPFLTLKQTALVPLIEEVVNHFRLQNEGALFVTQFEACEAAVDPLLLRQALSNLVQNGLEAMSLEDKTEKKSLTVRVGYLGDGFVEIKISDTGRGIPNDQLDKIFLPFFTTKAKGNGLGLALVHKTILSHNGTISVESEENKGATFTITVPVNRA